MKKMLITGASGFLGSRIKKYFEGIYELSTPSHKEMDITQEEAVHKQVLLFQPDVIIHCAAMSDVGRCAKEPDISWERNVTGSVNMAKAAKLTGAKCILCSSDQVYFATPSNLYAKEKLAAEQDGLKENPDCVFLRLSWMYDPALTDTKYRSDFFTNLLTKLHTDEEVSYAVFDKRGITDVNEVIHNLEKAMNLPGGVYDFGSPNDKTMYNTVRCIFSALDLDVSRVKENRDAFKEQPRDMTMSQNIVKQYDIHFTDTTSALICNFQKYVV